MIFKRNYKCNICIESKFINIYFYSIKKSSEPQGIIYSDINNLKFIQTRDWKNYHITFIDDCTRYYYKYSHIIKYKALDLFKYYKKGVENQLDKKINRLRLICYPGLGPVETPELGNTNKGTENHLVLSVYQTQFLNMWACS